MHLSSGYNQHNQLLSISFVLQHFIIVDCNKTIIIVKSFYFVSIKTLQVKLEDRLHLHHIKKPSFEYLKLKKEINQSRLTCCLDLINSIDCFYQYGQILTIQV